MKGFYIEVTNNLLDSKHRERMGESVWLFMWLLDKITNITEKKGKVLGGKPIKYREISADLGISRSTYIRWMGNLEKWGYITTLRTPYGKCIIVLKAKKRFSRDVLDKKHLNRSVKKETSPESTTSGSDTSPVSDMAHLQNESDTCNIEHPQLDITVDNINTIDADASKTKNNGIKKTVAIKKLVKKNTPTPKPPSPDPRINDAIALFLQILPGDFIGAKTAFAKPPTREAVGVLLKRYSLDALQDMIQKYDAGKSDEYRPGVGTVYEFCTSKLAKVEAYVSKSQSGGLWAHRSISTPEQSKVRDEQYQKKMDTVLEDQKKSKEEWLKEHPEEN